MREQVADMHFAQEKFLLAGAIEIATEAHKGQTRWDKTVPYITHPLAVMALVGEEELQRVTDGGPSMIALQVVAVLHDVVEDTSVTLEHLLGRGIPGYMVDGVNAITKRKGEEYHLYLKRVSRSELASKVKIQDITHNLSDLKKGSMRDKYLLAREYLREKLL